LSLKKEKVNSEGREVTLGYNIDSVYFDVLDLSTVIDTFADMKAVEAFEKEMRDSKK
jgi:hypothetical protein